MSEAQVSQGDTGADEGQTLDALDAVETTEEATEETTEVTEEVQADDSAETAEDESSDIEALPDSAEGYVFTPPEGMDDVDEGSYDSFREFAFDKKLSQEHFQEVLEFSAERDKRIISEYETTLEEGRQAVRDEMGDKLDSNLSKVKEVMRASGQEPPENDNDILDNPALMKFILWTSEKIGQDSLGTATGHAASQGEPSAEDVLFGDMFKK